VRHDPVVRGEGEESGKESVYFPFQGGEGKGWRRGRRPRCVKATKREKKRVKKKGDHLPPRFLNNSGRGGKEREKEKKGGNR